MTLRRVRTDTVAVLRSERWARCDWLELAQLAQEIKCFEKPDFFEQIEPSASQHPKCLFGEHHAVAAQAQTLEWVEAEAAVDLVLVEVSNPGIIVYGIY